MAISTSIAMLRNRAKLSEEKFAELFSASAENVTNWENGTETPDMATIVQIAKHFRVSMDALLETGMKKEAPMPKGNEIKPNYAKQHEWED